MQITPGMRVSDVCMFCFEHTNDQPCPEYEAWIEEQGLAEIEAGDHPADCLFCQGGEASVHTYEPSGDNPYEEI